MGPKVWQLPYLALVFFALRSLAAREPTPGLVVALLLASTIEGLFWILEILTVNGEIVAAVPEGSLMPNGTDNPAVLLWLFAIPFKIITIIVFGLAIANIRRRQRLPAQPRPPGISN